ncbi:MAG TPA: hypothetical protein VGO46_05480 [Gemmatimonadaceae bacterium]|nr:hypothetical protein [Gemmatimonadaceae bacterium]
MSAAMGCHHHAQPVVPASDTTAAIVSSPPGDSLIGIVSVTGTSFEQRIVLRTGKSTRALGLWRDDSAAIAQVGGAEVVVHGVDTATAFTVRWFAVRSVDGAPVVDGVLERRGGHLVLHTRTGVVSLGNPPIALDSLEGSRVWIGGPLATGPNVYGVIARAGPNANDRIHLPSEH